MKIKNFMQFKNIAALDRAYGKNNWVYVARTNTHYGLERSALANPFKVNELGREDAIANYRVWLWKKILNEDDAVMEALRVISNLNENSERETALVCWCHPEPCHAEIILRAVQSPEVKQRISDWCENQVWNQ